MKSVSPEFCKEVYDTIKDYITRRNIVPSEAELSNLLNKSVNIIHTAIIQLHSLGVIRKEFRKRRAITILKDYP